MPDLAEGEVFLMKGSAAKPYELKNTGGVYSCSCPAWRNQGGHPNHRTCKHLRSLRGAAVEDARVGAAGPTGAAPPSPPAVASGAPPNSGVAAPPRHQAHGWDHAQDLAGWWMSEKLDGVRAYWDGHRFISRLGNPYLAPDWFTAGLPDTPLDGELWSGRKKFQRTISIVRRQDRSDDWRELRYVVFDAPARPEPFEKRLDHLHRHFQTSKASHAAAHPHQVCRSLDHLRAELARVEALGGEGLMLRQPQSTYEVGRSSTLLKVKSFFDAEARVVGHQGGAGKHLGRLGALEVEMPNGTRFHVGTGFSDAERKSPPPIGAVITYRYQELSEAGVPRFPSYVAVRDDLPWPPPGS